MMTRTKTTAKSSRPLATAIGGTSSGAEDSAEESEAQPTLSDLHAVLVDFKNSASTKLDSLTKEVSAISSRFDKLEDSVNFNSDKIQEIEKKTVPDLKASLEKTVKSLESKILTLEIHNRKSNLLFYGLQQKDGENIYEVLKKAFISLGIDDAEASSIMIANAHRLPRRESGTQAARQMPIPVIARFCFMRDRNRVLAAFEDQVRKRLHPEIDSFCTRCIKEIEKTKQSAPRQKQKRKNHLISQ